MIMEQNKTIPGLTYKRVSEDMVLLIDMREPKERYVGLICQIPFRKGYMLCPWVRKRLHFDLSLSDPKHPKKTIPFPRQFRNTERALNWCMRWVDGWKVKPRYTIFNPLIKLLGLHGQAMYVFCQESKLHLAFTQFVIAILAFFYPTSNIAASIAIKATAVLLCLFGILNLIICVHDRKIGIRGGNKKDYH